MVPPVYMKQGCHCSLKKDFVSDEQVQQTISICFLWLASHYVMVPPYLLHDVVGVSNFNGSVKTSAQRPVKFRIKLYTS